MKKFFNSLKFILKAFLLVIILLVGWAFINITNLIKGKKSLDKDSLSKNMFGADEAKAEIPENTFSCPFVAYFDGKKFQIENDFLCGKFSRYFRSITSQPDLLKFYHAPKKRDGKLAFQLQENEAEESFINQLRFIRVAHPKNSEVIVDSGFEKFHVIEWASLQKITSAKEVLVNGAKDASNRFNDKKKFFEKGFESNSLILNKNDRLEFAFSNLKNDSNPVLIVKSTFRDFMMGEVGEMKKIASFASFIYSPAVLRLGLLFITAIYFVFGRKTFGDWPAFLPVIFGTEVKSIRFSYRDEMGNFKQAAINKPRAWNFSSEAIALPKEAVMEDGSMCIKAEFTKRHKLAFAGVLQSDFNLPYRDEELFVKSANSSRLGDVSELISGKNKKSLHLIPGDTVDIELEDPIISLNKDEKETYLMQSFGVYTPLSSKYKKIAGDWFKKIPAEVRDYYARMAKK
ncbi:hypothetical protein A2819_00760 [Candidatus Azambacteria bacterium RIFCSPHIGHO2_01_FULL_40_24]|uniref:Uncharacterized protein n=1 Tax=Candidatus Azambacteria bacterium RIFCSPHIGHO2_01_FULL_40_24 TaxID=1797301 RepID=A0A1F5B2C5_9BACT|nr:MAG: hypothetical protein A2819_00760 [Candidatus Azambacteria bacterium RIFCSPHIGHO2_01_FULL_40_24]